MGTMKAGTRLFLLFVGIGLLLWVADAALDALFVYSSFAESLAATPHERYMRSLITALVVGLGAVVSWQAAKRARHERICRQNEEALRNSEREKTSILDSLTEMVTYQDANLVIRWANRAAIENAEGRRVDLIGSRCYEAVHGRHEPCEPCPVREALQTGRPASGEVVLRNGGIWSVSAYPVRDDAGQVVGVVESALNITERREAETQVRNLARFPAENPAPVLRIADDATVLYANAPAEAVLADLESGPGRPAPDTWRTALRQALATAEVRRLEVIHADRTYALRFVPVSDTGYVNVYGEDITERKEAEEEVRHLAAELEDRVRRRTAELTAANEELEAFASSVSHDLRAPLRHMEGFSEALLDEYAGVLDETGRDYLRRVRKGAQHMGRLIDDLLTLSRATRADMHRETVDLSLQAEVALTHLRETEPDREVQTDVQDGLTAEADPRLLNQVMQNLLENAWKFTRDARPARITVRRLPDEEARAAGANGEAVFAVEDNGVGFDPKYANKLFQVFQRLHERDAFPGTGVGLATVQRIVRRHGGRVWAKGRPGEGAAFYFTLG